MNGIYGEFLLAFPEQFKTAIVYDMHPKINGGWIEVPGSRQYIRCIYQHTGGKRITISNGNTVQSSGMELWTENAGLNGKFTTIENTVYRLVSDNQWTNEGGFCKYSLDKVVGNNGAESADTTWNLGSHNFG